MPKNSLAIGVMALAAAVVLPAQVQAEHENRYFGFSFRPFPQTYTPPPVLYELPPGVRETAPGIYEYQVSPGRWVRFNPGFDYQPRRERARVRQQPQEAPVSAEKPEATDDPEVAVEVAPEIGAQPETQATAASAGRSVSCEDAGEIVKSFGFSDVKSTSCSGAVYGFDASRDGSNYSIKLSAADGALTEVRKR